MVEGKKQWRSGVIGGLVAGRIGGVVMAMFMMFMNMAKGQEVWAGMKFPALPFLHDRVMQPGFAFGPVLLGMMSHFAVSSCWGIPFGVLFFGATKPATVAWGGLWGIVVWLGMFYVILPIVGAGQTARMMPAGMALFEHLLFGIVVGLGFLPYQRPRRAGAEAPRQVTVTH